MASLLPPLPSKQIRSELIVRHIIGAGYAGAVIFSCGNAAAALKAAAPPAMDVLAIAPGHDLKTERWWTPEEIKRAWPERFDATSGHLPMPLMAALARTYRHALDGQLTEHTYRVPTGSGETVLCLRLAFSQHTFIAEYDDRNLSTRFDKGAPLNSLVASSGPVVRRP